MLRAKSIQETPHIRGKRASCKKEYEVLPSAINTAASAPQRRPSLSDLLKLPACRGIRIACAQKVGKIVNDHRGCSQQVAKRHVWTSVPVELSRK